MSLIIPEVLMLACTSKLLISTLTGSLLFATVAKASCDGLSQFIDEICCAQVGEQFQLPDRQCHGLVSLPREHWLALPVQIKTSEYETARSIVGLQAESFSLANQPQITCGDVNNKYLGMASYTVKGSSIPMSRPVLNTVLCRSLARDLAANHDAWRFMRLYTYKFAAEPAARIVGYDLRENTIGFFPRIAL